MWSRAKREGKGARLDEGVWRDMAGVGKGSGEEKEVEEEEEMAYR